MSQRRPEDSPFRGLLYILPFALTAWACIGVAIWEVFFK